MPFRVIGVYLPVEWSAPGDVKRVKLNKLKEKTEEESSSRTVQSPGGFVFHMPRHMTDYAIIMTGRIVVQTTIHSLILKG